MARVHQKMSTGLNGLDEVLKGLKLGDNVVWQTDTIEEYAAFVVPFCKRALQQSRRLIYFRFGNHGPLLPEDCEAEVHELNPEEGLEQFIADVHGVIEAVGRGAYYVFDCLSDLLTHWYSDHMLASFFMLTCPYLYDLETVTYFCLLRNQHSSHAIDPILKTTQLFVDVFTHEGDIYVRPIKVQHRYSPTMEMVHVWRGEEFSPVSASVIISQIQTRSWAGLDSDIVVGSWERAFVEAQGVLEAVEQGEMDPVVTEKIFRNLARMILSRDEGMLELLTRYLTLEDVLQLYGRMIGSGLIGGKTVGMLLARAIIRERAPELYQSFEPHDSFYIGSDVFYTFLVRNGVWWLRQKQRSPSTFLDDAALARQRILAGVFPDYLLERFSKMLAYFGQSPIVVRSSSLLEDNFGNSFAGKYESVFCANQGPREQRLEDFLAAVRTIYASTMSEEALRYRERRGLLESDEQMALLVMRVSGARHGHFYYPHAAGVGFSFNPYAWSPKIDPKAGVLRLVFGLGTRAVDRSDDDYTRVVALNAPGRRPEANFDEVRQYAQRRVDYLDLDANQLVSGQFPDVVARSNELPLGMFAGTDSGRAPRAQDAGSLVLTFDGLLGKTDFVTDMRRMLSTLEEAYKYPVDIEFTANFFEEDRYLINLVQCRPLPVQGDESKQLPDLDLDREDAVIRARGAVIGQTRVVDVGQFVYVVPSEYSKLNMQDRYAVARMVGRVNHAYSPEKGRALVLLGPGRWGTRSPSLGVPVSFTEINRVAVLCEIVTMREGLIPDASLGTHFLNELVEMDILYLALFPQQEGNYLGAGFLEQAPNRLCEVVEDAERWQDIVRVVRAEDVAAPGEAIVFAADAQAQRVACFRENRSAGTPVS